MGGFITELKKDNERRIEWIKKYYPADLKQRTSIVTYFQIGYKIGSLFHLDHCKPLFMGGDGIGIHNVQILCVPCHKTKTIKERSSPCKK